MRDMAFEYSFGCFKGCLGAIALVVFSIVVIGHVGGCFEHLRKERVARNAEEAKKRIAEEKTAAKRADIRDFALNNAPKIWEMTLKVAGEITNQNERIAKLRETMIDFNRIPELDADYVAICSKRDELVRIANTLQDKLEDAYLASKKYEAMPDNVDYKTLMSQVLTDGVREAESAEKFYDKMKLEKENSECKN